MRARHGPWAALALGALLSAPVIGPRPLFAGEAPPIPRFRDRAAEAGITHAYVGGWAHFVGGGAAVFDCDGDRMPEVLAAGGSAPLTLVRNRAGAGEALSLVADTPPELAIKGVIGAYPLHLDADDHVDLVILRDGTNAVFLGQGNCRFRDATAELGLAFDPADWTTAFSATWEGDATLPTLAFGNYVDRRAPDGPFGHCDDNLLFRPRDGRYPAPLRLAPGYCALSMLFSDWGHRGRQDLRISNDRHYYVRGGAEQLWAMEPVPRLYGRDDGWQKHELWGMGIASRDLDGDAIPEVFLTSMADQKLQALRDGATGPDFRNVPYDRGTTAQRPYIGGDGRPSTGWHAEFGDVNNDGRDDLLIVKGNVDAMPGSAMKDPNNLLLQGPDGRFAEAGDKAGIASLARGRGGALVDLNLDGRLDIVVVNRRAPIEILENTGPAPGHWIEIELTQDGPNRDLVGGWIEVRTDG
ncbi:MAG: VCBS repeat-containing protein, partial [Alphaproteobacteria bacterium]